ncbi:MAG: SGNH/GDSL hydrolase family protein [Clostridia bacterium]|nr:SGNH/GDSL hydrolase family protein [Clostridia bacterium]
MDNKLVESYKTESEIVYKASGEKQRFTLHFPYYAFPIITSVKLEDATVFLPQKRQVDILFLGDSITHGANSVNPSNTYVMRVARNMDIGILNQGNSGFVYDEGSIEKVCEPKIVVTAYGINDFHRKNIELIDRDTTEFLQKLKETYKNSKIVSILPLWTVWNGNDENYKVAERNCIKSIYEEYSDYIIDGYNLVPHNKKYFADELHPNDQGFAFYGDKLTKELESIILKI